MKHLHPIYLRGLDHDTLQELANLLYDRSAVTVGELSVRLSNTAMLVETYMQTKEENQCTTK